jgi:hypothetical protein
MGDIMRLKSLWACAFALALAGCASVPTLRGAPEDIANQIGGNAVAYNQAYGRAIADQVLLNVLRARDRLPLYHLSMSGITDTSELQQSGQLQLGSISLGDGNGGVGQLTGGRTLITKPQYVLNPFSSDPEHPRARQFEPVAYEVFQHFWDNNWPTDVLLLVMVESLIVEPETNPPSVLTNGSAGARGDCGRRPTAEEERIGTRTRRPRNSRASSKY